MVMWSWATHSNKTKNNLSNKIKSMFLSQKSMFVFLSKFLYIKVVNYGIKWQFLLFFKHHPYSVKPVLSGHPTTPCGWLLNTVWTVLFCFLIKIFKGFVFLSGKVQSAADGWWERMHYWMWRNRFKKPTFITIRTSSACNVNKESLMNKLLRNK